MPRPKRPFQRGLFQPSRITAATIFVTSRKRYPDTFAGLHRPKQPRPIQNPPPRVKGRKNFMEQLSLFDMVDDFPCHNCYFNQRGCCAHIQTAEIFCVRGSFQVKPSQTLCPDCGKPMNVMQSDFGKDGASCPRCGTRVIFNNQGNRPSAFELYKRGELIGH